MYLFSSTLSRADLHVYIYIAPFLKGNDFTRGIAKGHLKFELPRDAIHFTLSGSLRGDFANAPLRIAPHHSHLQACLCRIL